MIKQQKAGVLQKAIGISGFIVSVFLVASFFKGIDLLLKYLQQNSPDHQLSGLTVLLIHAFFVVLIIMIFGISLLLFLGITKRLAGIVGRKTAQFLNRLFNFDDARRFILKDQINKSKHFSLWAFLISAFVGIVLHFNVLYFGIPPYEGTMEKVSTLVLLMALMFVFTSIFYVNRVRFPKSNKKKLFYILLVGSGILFLMFGEEISWGQRIFGWESTGVFAAYNYQKETNLHNFINPVLDLVYPTVGLISLILLFMVRLFPAKGFSYMYDLFLPHPSLLFLLLLMGGASFNGQSELYESMLSVFLFFYGLRILVCLRKPNLSRVLI